MTSVSTTSSVGELAKPRKIPAHAERPLPELRVLPEKGLDRRPRPTAGGTQPRAHRIPADPTVEERDLRVGQPLLVGLVTLSEIQGAEALVGHRAQDLQAE